MKFRKAFFILGLIITITGLFIGKMQFERYQTVLFENSPASNIISDDNGRLLSNSFSLQLRCLNFDYHSSDKVKQVTAKLTCSYLEEKQNKIVSVNHPARFHQYYIYIQDYWTSSGQTPAGARLSLVKQPGQWLVYLGLILLMSASLWESILLIRKEFNHLLPKVRRWILFAFIGTTTVILLLNPMMRGNLPPILRSVWFYPHIFFFVLSYALLLTSFVAAGLELKRNWDCSYFCFRLGIYMYTIGLVLGMIWAKAAWGDFWNWDPKETAALITWGAYLITFHYTYSCKELTRKKWVVLEIFCFLCLLLSWFGVQLFRMGGLHVY